MPTSWQNYTKKVEHLFSITIKIVVVSGWEEEIINCIVMQGSPEMLTIFYLLTWYALCKNSFRIIY